MSFKLWLMLFVWFFCPAGSHATLQRQRTGREAVHPDPDPPEKRAVAAELAAEAQLHAPQQLHAEGHWEPSEEQLGSHRTQSPVLLRHWRGPEPECRHLTWGLRPAGCTAPPAGEEDCRCWCIPSSDGTRPISVSCLISVGLPIYIDGVVFQLFFFFYHW